MPTVADILSKRDARSLASLSPTATVRDALQLMADRNIGSVLIMQGEALLGIFTERDYARKIALMGRTSAVTQVKDVMTSAVMFVKPDQTSEQCMQIMSNNRLRHLPVLNNGKLVGMISIGDLVKDIISEQKFIIEQLENYITGSH